MIRLMTCTVNDGGSNWEMSVRDMEERRKGSGWEENRRVV